jgi:hypothetical protein
MRASSCTKTKRADENGHERPLYLFMVWMAAYCSQECVPTGRSTRNYVATVWTLKCDCAEFALQQNEPSLMHRALDRSLQCTGTMLESCFIVA